MIVTLVLIKIFKIDLKIFEVRKGLFIGLLVMLVSTPAISQDCIWYDHWEVGQAFEMKNYNAKGKMTSLTKYNVLEKSANNITIQANLYDTKEKETNSFNFNIACEGDAMRMDMSSMLSGNIQSLDGFKLNMTAESTNLIYLANLKVGTELPDGHFASKGSVDGIDLGLANITCTISNRKAISEEIINLGGRDYEVIKIIGTNDLKVGFIKIKGKFIEWYCPKKGMVVKSEFYNKKNKLTSYSEIFNL